MATRRHECNRCKKWEIINESWHTPRGWSLVSVSFSGDMLTFRFCKGCTTELQRFSLNKPVQLAT